MKQPKELLDIAANSSVHVLIMGESGAGKEVAARYIHEHSPRRFGPFVAVNCAALSQNLIESTLEGSVKGSFTGAYADQKGLVRASNGGTLFLDEIGELPLNAQSKFLRVLQEKAVLPVGSSRSIPVDFRLVCATNRNLKQEVAAKRFREDLYFRLNVFPVVIPPLRDRDDFEEIAVDLWKNIGETARRTHFDAPKGELSGADIKTLRLFKWPGNVRQLKNVLQRYALLQPHGITLKEILGEEYASSHTGHESRTVGENFVPKLFWGRRRAEAPEWSIIKETLELCNWNKSEASQRLGVSRGCIYYQIQKNKLQICG